MVLRVLLAVMRAWRIWCIYWVLYALVAGDLTLGRKAPGSSRHHLFVTSSGGRRGRRREPLGTLWGASAAAATSLSLTSTCAPLFKRTASVLLSSS